MHILVTYIESMGATRCYMVESKAQFSTLHKYGHVDHSSMYCSQGVQMWPNITDPVSNNEIQEARLKESIPLSKTFRGLKK